MEESSPAPCRPPASSPAGTTPWSDLYPSTWGSWGASHTPLRLLLAWWPCARGFPAPRARPHPADRRAAWERSQARCGRSPSWAWPSKILRWTAPGPAATPAVTPAVPEASPGACSQPPHSGIWTPLYNLPKEDADPLAPERQLEPQGREPSGGGGAANRAGVSASPRPPSLGSSGGP